MKNVFFQSVCRTGIFMICAHTIVHFRPDESYEKYLKLLVGVMVLVQLFIPLCSMLPGIGDPESAEGIDNFKAALEAGMEEARQKALETDAMLEEMTLNEVRKRMEEQAESEQENINVEIEGIRVEPVESISGTDTSGAETPMTGGGKGGGNGD